MRHTEALDSLEQERTRPELRRGSLPGSATSRKISEILSFAGIEINGDRPWDLQVHDGRFFDRALSDGSVGVGESYVDGWWDAESLDKLFARIQTADLNKRVGGLSTGWLALKSRLLNNQTRSRSRHVAEVHYDLGNDLYQMMLDRHMQYTCAYWGDAKTLDDAQENKLRLICRKLQLEPGLTVLELGGGFGGLARFIAVEYGCNVVSYNISTAQVAYGRERCAGLPVRFEQRDYREAAREPQQFDRIVSVGLCEHIGHKNYRGFMELAYSRLKKEGLFLLHTIGGNESRTFIDPWINKYIFRGAMIPSVAQLGKAMERLLVVEDWHSFGADYDRTLMAWWDNFDRTWPILRAKYGDRFYRMWKYYLLSSAGGFRARKLQLWQIALSKGDISSYMSVR